MVSGVINGNVDDLKQLQMIILVWNYSLDRKCIFNKEKREKKCVIPKGSL